ncbi:MAG: hypothetical protein MZV64_44755 [Ignavibacteriales bacterium]|nr:hypothetical protein [Ignavibacteriales bacterium]
MPLCSKSSRAGQRRRRRGGESARSSTFVASFARKSRAGLRAEPGVWCRIESDAACCSHKCFPRGEANGCTSI